MDSFDIYLQSDEFATEYEAWLELRDMPTTIDEMLEDLSLR